jgi:FkbM family methyltransferase
MKIISNKRRIKLLKYLLHKVFKINVPDYKKCKIYEGIIPIHTVASEWGEFKLFCPSRMVFYRSKSFFTKEPETVEWIRTFNSQETLFDIGANIGIYSLLAAKTGVKVVAFEPEPQNFSVLTMNIYLNQLSDLIVPLNLAICDRMAIDFLYMPVFGVGNAFNQFGVQPDLAANLNSTAQRQFVTASSSTAARQFVMAYTVDSFLAMFPNHVPNHIKIDVDGLEKLVVAGACKTLENSTLKSLLVEFDSKSEASQQTIDFIQSKGFRIHSKNQRIEQDFFNYIFRRS